MIGKSKPSEFRRHHHSILVLDAAGMSDDKARAGLVSEMDVSADFSGQAVRIDREVEDIELHAASAQFFLKK